MDCLVSKVAVLLLLAAGAQSPTRDEEQQDYFRKWLETDVVYLISDQEREVFQQLSSEDEKVQFIEAFWRRRNPNPNGPGNPFKEEHYRRIAYANDRYSAGVPGWKTDRGMVYIKFGPPAQIDAYPTGTVLQDNRGGAIRAMEQGVHGGVTPRQVRTFPFEVWRYRYIEGIGNDVELEFVDRTGSGLYTLSADPEDKNVFAHSDAQSDIASLNRSDLFRRDRDRQFSRTELMARVTAPPAVEFSDLQQVVTSRVQYDQLPFEDSVSLLRVTDNSFYVPVTIVVPASHLDFRTQGEMEQAAVNVFLQAVDIRKRITAIAEDTLTVQGTSAQLARLRQGNALYSKKLLLPPGRHVIDLVVRDVHSGKLGTRQELVEVPHTAGRLSLSGLILADVMRPLRPEESVADPFAVGSHLIIPNVAQRYRRSQSAGLFFQIYGFQADQSTGTPSLQLQVRFRQGDKSLVTVEDDLSSFGQVSGEQASVTVSVPLKDFPQGRIEVEVTVKDLISGQSVRSATYFEVAGEGDAKKESGVRNQESGRGGSDSGPSTDVKASLGGWGRAQRAPRNVPISASVRSLWATDGPRQL